MDVNTAELADQAEEPVAWARRFARSVDRALLGTLTAPARFPSPAECSRVSWEVEQAAAVYAGRAGGVVGFHRTPPACDAPRLLRRRQVELPYEQLTFESGYAPASADPSRARWLAHPGNHLAHAWVLRHRDDRDRPWLFCLHGMGTGWPLMDFAAFRVRQLHQELGLNLVLPVMPLHGPRRAPSISVAALASYELMDTFHGFTQALWDVRRLIGWARAQGATRIGAYGMSAGALLAGLAAMFEELQVLIAGIPLCDILDLIEHHVPLDRAAQVQLLGPATRDLFALISPLGGLPGTPLSRRAIYAGVDDLVTTARQAERLWLHWDQPDVHWYPGAHVSFFWAPSVPPYVAQRLRAAAFAREETRLLW